MPPSATLIFTNTGLVPFYPGYTPKRMGVRLPNSATYVRGTVLGEKIGRDAVYTVTLGVQSSGTFTLTVAAQTTAPIAFNAPAAAVQAALSLLSTVVAGGVVVSGAAGGPYTVVFLSQAVTLTGSGALLTTPANFSVTQVTAGIAGTPGTFAAYASGNTDGSQAPKAILEHDCAVDASGNITLGPAVGASEWGQTYSAVPAFFAGDFSTAELTGLDATALTNQPSWRLINGSLTSGVLRLP